MAKNINEEELRQHLGDLLSNAKEALTEAKPLVKSLKKKPVDMDAYQANAVEAARLITRAFDLTEDYCKLSERLYKTKAKK